MDVLTLCLLYQMNYNKTITHKGHIHGIQVSKFN